MNVYEVLEYLIDNKEDCHSYIMWVLDLSIYWKAVRTKDRKLPTELVLGNSVMSGCHLQSIISEHHLRSIISGCPLF